MVDDSSADCGVALVTAGSQPEAAESATALVKFQLAACVSIFPTHSVYTWQGELHQAQEWRLLIKTNLQQFPALEAKIRQLHSYEVPEIVALPLVAGYQPYLQWLTAQVN